MQVNQNPGKYIMLEGEEGAGKTTQLSLLEDRMRKSGIDAVSVKEPSRANLFGRLAYAIYSYESEHDAVRRELSACLGAPEFSLAKSSVGAMGGRHIARFESIAADFLKGGDSELPFLLQLAMILARRELLRTTVLPKLQSGTHVLSDRGFFSTLAYGASEGLDWEELLALHRELLGDLFVMPNLAIILDIDPREGLLRTLGKQGGQTDHFDSEDLQAKIRQCYLELADDKRFSPFTRVLSGAGTSAEVHEAVWGEVSAVL